MAYDYAGSWDSVTGHQADLQSTQRAVDFYARSVPPEKLVIGLPLYGRSFMATDGVGCPFNGVGDGSWERGSYDFKALPLPGSVVGVDRQAAAGWCHHPQTREWVSYDTRETAELKADWIVSRRLGGAMYWETSGDRTDSDSIIAAVARKLLLEKSPNHLRYPSSKFDNVRDMH